MRKLPIIQKKLHGYSVPQQDRFGFGALTSVTEWGFPGSISSHVDRVKYPPWFVGSSVHKLVNTSVLRRVKKNTGEVSHIIKDVGVLRYAVAARSGLQRGKGTFVEKNIPELLYPKFMWLTPSRYVRSEARIIVKPGIATFFEEESSNYGYIKTETVFGYPNYATYNENPLLKQFWNVNGYPVGYYNLIQIANSRCLKRIRDNEVEISVALATSKSTLRMLSQTALTIMKIRKAVLKGHFNEVWRLLRVPPGTSKAEVRKKFFSTKDLSQRWLELQYGWKPLLDDANGAIKFFLADKKLNITYKVSGSVTEDSDYESIIPGTLARAEEVYTAHVKRTVRTVVHYAVTDPAKVFMGQGGVNPLLAVWEVVPWSFIVDWFLTIGTALETLDAQVGKEFISGTTTCFTRAKTFSLMNIQKEQVTGTWIRTGNNRSLVEGHYMSMDRSVLHTWPNVNPRFKNPFSTPHVVNAIALARSLRKR